MPQFLRPDSDISNGWTCSSGSSRYALIDEAEVDYADYIYNAGATSDYQTCGLSNPALAIPVKTGHKLHFWASNSASNLYALKYELLQGATVKKSGSFATSKSAWNHYEIALTEAEANGITNYNDLRIKVWGYRQYLACFMLELPSPEVCLEMGCAA